jgi:5-hydroxyisourate hydrolase
MEDTVPDGRPTISTHVLDTAGGSPAAGIRVRLARLDGGVATPVGAGVTDADGRVRDLLGGQPLEPGRYRLAFDLGEGRFFEAVALDIRVEDAGRIHHVPLLLSTYGITMYRGS